MNGKASDRFHSRYHFAFADSYSNLYHFLLFGKKRQWQRSTLPMIMGFGQIDIFYTYQIGCAFGRTITCALFKLCCEGSC